MIHPARGSRGMAVAPHAAASQSALAVLREGGNALEAMVAAAATIPIVYPHMNSIGGDSFWLVHVPGRAVRGIDACGAAARAATIEWYSARGVTGVIPHRGGDDIGMGRRAQDREALGRADAPRAPPRGCDALCAEGHRRYREPARGDIGEARRAG